MADEPAPGDEVEPEVPDAVKEWLSSIAEERGVSETELLRSLLAGDQGAAVGDSGIDDRQLERIERDFREMVEDVRERIVQVKRETDEKAPTDHSHHDLRNKLEQLGREVGALEAQVEDLDDQLTSGFENYEDILTYLTDTTDELNLRLGRLASAVIDLRERMSEVTRDEVRRTALSHLTDTANRHGVEKAKCGDCEEGVDISMLIEPRCPHCDSSFSSLEPKGFFRSSVLHTGTLPALESAPEAEETEDELASIVDEVEGDVGDAPAVETGASDRSAEPATTVDGPDPATAEDAPTAAEPSTAGEPTDETTVVDDAQADGQADLRTLEGIGSAYAERLADAGIDDLHALAVADPEQLGETIDVPPGMVADWIEQADARTET